MDETTPDETEASRQSNRGERDIPEYLPVIILGLALCAIASVLLVPLLKDGLIYLLVREWLTWETYYHVARLPSFGFLIAPLFALASVGVSLAVLVNRGRNWSRRSINIALTGGIIACVYWAGFILYFIEPDRPDGNLGAGLGAMRTIVTAEQAFQEAGLRMVRGVGQYADLPTLAEPPGGSAPFIDDTLGSGMKHGYTFILTVTDGNPPKYTCTALPLRVDYLKSFFVDETGVIRFASGGTRATVDSAPVQ